MTVPDWSFSSAQDLHCPLCDELLSGLNWTVAQDGEYLLAEEVTVQPAPHVSAMVLIPCGHELPVPPWELKFSGRNRVIGTVTKTPSFVKKEK